jgi:hypothetical protein
MADSSTHLNSLSSGASSKEVTANGLFDAASPAMTLGRHDTACSGLTWGYYGGVVTLDDGTPFQIVNGTKTLTNAATNYLELDTSDGSVDLNTSGWTAGKTRLYSIVVSGGLVTGYTDWRTGGGGSGAAAAADVSIADAGGYFTGTDVEAALQELGADVAVLSASADVDTDEVFTSDTGSTADSDPGNGLFKWNHAAQSSATALYIDNQNAAGVSLAAFFASLPPDGYIHLVQDDDATKYQVWKWSGLPTAGSGYYKFTGLTLLANGGSLADAKSTSISFKGVPPSTHPYDEKAFYPGAPASSAILLYVPMARAVTFPANFGASAAGGTSYGKASVAATGSTVFDIKKNGSSVGTMTFAAAATSATFTSSAGAVVSFSAGDVLSVHAPGTADATLANVGLVLSGTR